MAEISVMDWAQHMKIDYGQNLRKDSVKAKKDPHNISTGYYLVLVHFTVLQNPESSLIC